MRLIANGSFDHVRTGCVLALGLGLAGCYGNEQTRFPPGVEPWEANLAEMPAPSGDDVCEEGVLTFHRTTFEEVNAVHARGCIHQPTDVSWRAARDPQTGRDPASTSGFSVVEYDVDFEADIEPPDFSYVTHIDVDDIIHLEFENTWRHYLVEGTEEEPLLTATRFQKTWGSTALEVLEGSLVLSPHPDDPSVTLVEYQYHLDAIARDDHETIEKFLTSIFGRLVQRANDETLDPNDCPDCPQPPEGY